MAAAGPAGAGPSTAGDARRRRVAARTSAAGLPRTIKPMPTFTPPPVALLQRLRAELPRTLLILGVLCLGIALLLTAIDGRGFWQKLVYSLAIGTCCTVLVDGTRVGVSWLTHATRRSRGLPLQNATQTSGWHGVLPGVVLAIVLGPPAGIWLGDLVTGNRSPSLLAFGGAARVTLVITLLATLITLVLVATFERLAAARAEAEAARRLAAENQLRLLQSQLEPHMLFNTLANLRVLIGLDAARAQSMLDRLIAFLRGTLGASRLDRHPLQAEFAHLDDYLALMAVRMGPRLRPLLDLPPELSGTPMPPLLLQPLVENAIKHGLEPKVEGGRIVIAAQRAGDLLRLTVRDTGVGLGTSAGGSNFGLEQVRARLATLYGARASLRLQAADDAEGGVLATIELPLETAP